MGIQPISPVEQVNCSVEQVGGSVGDEAAGYRKQQEERRQHFLLVAGGLPPQCSRSWSKTRCMGQEQLDVPSPFAMQM